MAQRIVLSVLPIGSENGSADTNSMVKCDVVSTRMAPNEIMTNLRRGERESSQTQQYFGKQKQHAGGLVERKAQTNNVTANKLRDAQMGGTHGEGRQQP